MFAILIKMLYLYLFQAALLFYFVVGKITTKTNVGESGRSGRANASITRTYRSNDHF